MLTLIAALLLTVSLATAGAGTLIHALGASMPEKPDTGALALGRALAALGQVAAVTAAAALIHRHQSPTGALAYLAVFAALAATASLTTGRRVQPAGRHRATSRIIPSGASS
jgi:hypothetical protein